ncbi:hypothetical protein R9X47_01285 [Wukongibacter baidiensis]
MVEGTEVDTVYDEAEDMEGDMVVDTVRNEVEDMVVGTEADTVV